jgi:hypothetical protein
MLARFAISSYLLQADHSKPFPPVLWHLENVTMLQISSPFSSFPFSTPFPGILKEVYYYMPGIFMFKALIHATLIKRI